MRHPPHLLVGQETIQFNVDSDHWLDVGAFGGAFVASRTHEHEDLERCVVCMERLNAAADLYRGEFLTGFSVDSAPAEEWQVLQREALHMQALEAVTKLLGMTPDQIYAERSAGKTLADIAEDQGVSEQQMIDAIVAAQKEAIDQAVKDGRMTQDQADWMMARAEAMAPFMLSNPSGPRGGHGHGGRGGGHGWHGGTATVTTQDGS